MGRWITNDRPMPKPGHAIDRHLTIGHARDMMIDDGPDEIDW